MLYRETTRALLLRGLGPVHATQENFENGVFTLKMHQTFSVHTTSGKFENAAITIAFRTSVKFAYFMRTEAKTRQAGNASRAREEERDKMARRIT